MTLELSKLSGQVQAMGREMAIRDREYAEQVAKAQGWLTEYAEQAQQLGDIIRESSYNAAIPTDEIAEVILVDEANTDPARAISLALNHTFYRTGSEWYGLLHRLSYIGGPAAPALEPLDLQFEGGISLVRAAVLDRQADFVALSTYSGAALDYVQELRREMASFGLEMPIFIGGKLNRVPEDSPGMSRLPGGRTR